jgi:AbrB family looped-hinge helix DNA binding protein
MPIGKLGQRRQVVIPKEICEELGLSIGDYVEVKQSKGTVIIKPKKLVDADDVLTPAEEAIVRKGERQLREGKSKSWQQIKNDLAR